MAFTGSYGRLGQRARRIPSWIRSVGNLFRGRPVDVVYSQGRPDRELIAEGRCGPACEDPGAGERSFGDCESDRALRMEAARAHLLLPDEQLPDESYR